MFPGPSHFSASLTNYTKTNTEDKDHNAVLEIMFLYSQDIFPFKSFIWSDIFINLPECNLLFIIFVINNRVPL